MATLVLTAVGSLVGGPIGGAIGAALGSQVDGRLLGTRRRGPRLGDLTVQTSTYGAALPKLFGTMRVAGTVIWATDLLEDTHRSGGGKAGGRTTTYSYSASFAVALSARRVREVGRIWADGKLLRGAAGDWKSGIAAFRLHEGDEDQAIDPLIASAEGIAATPAHRGLAYAVFDGLQLADFGNRIPSLTFEVVADAGDVELGELIGQLSEGAATGTVGTALAGFAATGDSLRGAIEPLASAFALAFRDDGARLRLDDGAAVTVTHADLGAQADGETQARVMRDRQATLMLPDEIAIAYHEPARDWQAGLQRARRDGIATRGRRIDLPAALSAGEAKATAESALATAWARREGATVSLPWRHLALRAGTAIDLDGEAWRIAGWTLDRMVLRLTLERAAVRAGASAARPGRASVAADLAAGATVLHLLDLPAIRDGVATGPRLWLAAAGTGAGWRRAAVSLSLDGGGSWQPIGDTNPPAVIGTVMTMLPPGPAELFDRINTIDIDLLHDGMALPSGGMDAVVRGDNLALIGTELINFARAEQLTATRWRLAGLLRGRRGTEGAIGGHAAGERFVLIEPGRLSPVEIPAAALGGTAMVSAAAPGDSGPLAIAATQIADAGVRPPSPVALSCVADEDGALALRWTRRSRVGWTWANGGDVPLGEEREAYRLTIATVTGVRTIETTTSGWLYARAMQADDGLVPGSLPDWTVAQGGTFGLSLPARFGDIIEGAQP